MDTTGLFTRNGGEKTTLFGRRFDLLLFRDDKRLIKEDTTIQIEESLDSTTCSIQDILFLGCLAVYSMGF